MTTTVDTQTTKGLPTLSEPTVERLKALRHDRPSDFLAMVRSLRLNNWPLRAIATPLGVSRSAVAQWEAQIGPDAELPETETLPRVEKKFRTLYEKFEIPEDEAADLWDLAREASKVRRYTDYASPSRVAARKLETLLHYYHDQGASLAALAEACGVTRRAIAQRLEKNPDVEVMAS